MSGYHIPAEQQAMPRSETIHGVMAGRPMWRWQQDIKGAREDMMRGLALARTSAMVLAARRPTAQQVTCDYEIHTEEREVVHAIIDAAYHALYDAIDAIATARVALDRAHQQIGCIPCEWTRADTIRWSEHPELWGCTEADVARVDRIRAEGIFHTTSQETRP